MTRSLKNISNAVANRLGLELVPTWRIPAWPMETFLRRIFAAYDVDGIIDVGANLGQYRDFVRRQVGFEGVIVSFEPDSTCVETLRARAKDDDRWHIVPVALGARPDTAALQITSDSHFNSFLEPNPDGPTGAQFRDKNRVLREQQVEVNTLSAYVPWFADLGIRRPYLKLDTQGFDLEVLKGASEFLKEVVALQTEASVRAIYRGMSTYRDTLDALESRGFALSNVFPVVHDAALRIVEFDCVAVNQRFAELPS